jgi:hypothetical protein
MNPSNLQREPELDVLLTAGKPIEQVPDLVRARALARARASMEGAAAARLPATPRGSRRVLSLAIAASLVLVAGVAGAVVAIRTLVPQALPPAPVLKQHVVAPAPVAPAEPAMQPTVVAPAPSKRPARPSIVSESYAAELELLQRAQAAYAGRAFKDALTVVAEHRRRFPNGRLAEEREALRVRALSGAGRTSEARAAAAAFAERFPRSVLLPRLTPESH